MSAVPLRRLTGASGGTRWRNQVSAVRREPFEGVQLGPLPGKPSSGRMYRTRWNGEPVAVKARNPAAGNHCCRSVTASVHSC